VLMIAGGSITLLFDHTPWSRMFRRSQVQTTNSTELRDRSSRPLSIHSQEQGRPGSSLNEASLTEEIESRAVAGITQRRHLPSPPPTPTERIATNRAIPDNGEPNYVPSIIVGVLHLALFFTFFITVLVVHSQLTSPPLAFSLFHNMLLAGTIIFGGGPVVIPLLDQYVVKPGWVTSRDFLLGLAVQQGFPGPNFNFAVYLGCLTLRNNPVLGAFLGCLGIFTPGLTIRTGILPLWSYLRRFPSARSILRGVTPAAVGLIWSALVRLSQVAIVDANGSNNIVVSPFFVIVAAGGFVACEFFKLPPFLTVILGGAAGVVQWAVTGVK